MLKAINIKGYRFGRNANQWYSDGFAMLDTETDTFVSLDGFTPYILRTKKLVQACIDAGWPETMKRVAHSGTRQAG